MTQTKNFAVRLVAASHLCSAQQLKTIDTILTAAGCRVTYSPALARACQQIDQQCRLDTTLSAALLYEALCSGVDLVWTIRGGYGASRILPLLPKKPPKQHTWFVGASDATAVHLFLQRHWCWQTIHGVMPARSAELATRTGEATNCATSLKTVLNLLTTSQYQYSLVPLNDNARQLAVDQVITARLVGGNLSLVAASLATAQQVMSNDAILLLEDIAESAPRIERMLEQLLQATLLTSARALVIGELLLTATSSETLTQHPLIAAFVAQLPIPCYQIPNVGHGALNQPLLLGAIHSIKQHHAGWMLTHD